MTLSFAGLIAYITRAETLHPGEVICSGTVRRGSGMEIGKPLLHGDVVELEIDGIGRLRTRVPAHPSNA